MASNCTPSQLSVAVVGQTGAGKSSVINMIFDAYVASTSDKVMGCTTECELKEGVVPGYEWLYLKLYDTPGTGESSDGALSAKIAEEKIKKFLYSIEHGIHLLVFCVRKGRLTQATRESFKLFMDDLYASRVNCLLVITHCDFEKKIGSWYQKNKEDMQTLLKYKICEAVSVTTQKGNENNPVDDYCQTRTYLIEGIFKNALKEPCNLNTLKNRVVARLKSLYHLPGSPDRCQQHLDTPLRREITSVIVLVDEYTYAKNHVNSLHNVVEMVTEKLTENSRNPVSGIDFKSMDELIKQIGDMQSKYFESGPETRGSLQFVFFNYSEITSDEQLTSQFSLISQFVSSFKRRFPSNKRLLLTTNPYSHLLQSSFLSAYNEKLSTLSEVILIPLKYLGNVSINSDNIDEVDLNTFCNELLRYIGPVLSISRCNSTLC